MGNTWAYSCIYRIAATNAYIYIYTHIHVGICMYIHIYIYICIFNHDTCIYVYTHTQVNCPLFGALGGFMIPWSYSSCRSNELPCSASKISAAMLVGKLKERGTKVGAFKADIVRVVPRSVAFCCSVGGLEAFATSITAAL